MILSDKIWVYIYLPNINNLKDKRNFTMQERQHRNAPQWNYIVDWKQMCGSKLIKDIRLERCKGGQENVIVVKKGVFSNNVIV